MSVIKREVPSQRATGKGRYADLVRTATTEPGEWFSSPIESANPSAANIEAYRAIGYALGEVVVRGDTVYLRVKTSAELADQKGNE